MIDFDAIPDLDAPIEPWTPKVGDRVRITGAIAECQTRWLESRLLGHQHPEVEVGKSGRVHAIWDPARQMVNMTHLVAVEFDSRCPDCGAWGGNYAACELEPLENEA